MQKVNYHEYAVNNIVTIPQKPLTSHDYITVEGLVLSELCRACHADIMIKRLILERHLSDNESNTYMQMSSLNWDTLNLIRL